MYVYHLPYSGLFMVRGLKISPVCVKYHELVIFTVALFVTLNILNVLQHKCTFVSETFIGINFHELEIVMPSEKSKN